MKIVVDKGTENDTEGDWYFQEIRNRFLKVVTKIFEIRSLRAGAAAQRGGEKSPRGSSPIEHAKIYEDESLFYS
jgi:hypothetical protein